MHVHLAKSKVYGSVLNPHPHHGQQTSRTIKTTIVNYIHIAHPNSTLRQQVINHITQAKKLHAHDHHHAAYMRGHSSRDASTSCDEYSSLARSLSRLASPTFSRPRAARLLSRSLAGRLHRKWRSRRHTSRWADLLNAHIRVCVCRER